MTLTKSRVVGVCAVGLALLVAGCSSGGGESSTPTSETRLGRGHIATEHTVNGTVSIFTGRGCGALSGGPGSGTPVLVTNQAHAEIATSSLGPGVSAGTNNDECHFPFVATVPDATFYTFTMETHVPNGTALSARRSMAELQRVGWAVTISGYTGGGTGPADAAANLGPCPKTYPNASSTGTTPNVVGLAIKLVPIEVSNVRVCKYATTPSSAKNHLPAQLIGSALLGPPAAAGFTDETNRLPIIPRPDFGCGSGSGPEPIGPGPTFVLAFAGHSQQFTLIEDFARSGTSRPSACVVDNWVISARPTTQWSNELQRYTNAYPIGPELRMGPGMLTGPTGPTGPVSPAPTGAG